MKYRLFIISFILTISCFSITDASYDKTCSNYADNDKLSYLSFSTCSDKYSEAFDNWYSAYEKWEYEEAFEYFEIALKYKPESENVKYNITLIFQKLWEASYEKWDYQDAVKYYRSLVNMDVEYDTFYKIYVKLAYSYYYMWYEENLKKINQYFEEALNIANSQSEIDYVLHQKNLLESLSKTTTNDELAHHQYYLHSMNIPAAWDNVTEEQEVIVAVIDDGIYIHHPDLDGKIWKKPNLEYWESLVIDFTGDWLDNAPTWEHWTFVSWIIAAEQNNKEWISGIAKNVKIMPLRVFKLDGNTSTESIISAINYAIDNWANIINLSLGASQFKYSNEYDEVIKKAYNNNIIVVIAAWNWDILNSQKTGVDLTKNPISPVCNNWNTETPYSIGVYASDINWYRTHWTNYGDCAQFMAPWEGIVSTAIPIYNEEYGTNYNIKNGTSFSAPIISGIIALWFNQYWEVSPDIVNNALVNSLTENAIWNKVVDAAKYIDELAKYFAKMEQEKLEIKKNDEEEYTNDLLDVIDKDEDILKKEVTLEQAANNIAKLWIIKDNSDNPNNYNLNQNVLRQEIAVISKRLAWIDTKISCDDIFKDVSSIKPNNWICVNVEALLDKNLISKNDYFRPEENISKSEALIMLIKSIWFDFTMIDASNWQQEVVDYAVAKWVIDNFNDYNALATRGWIFDIADSLIKIEEKEKWIKRAVYSEDY